MLFSNRWDYTYYSAPHSLYAKIDYFITFGKDKDKRILKQTQIEFSTKYIRGN